MLLFIIAKKIKNGTQLTKTTDFAAKITYNGAYFLVFIFEKNCRRNRPFKVNCGGIKIGRLIRRWLELFA